MPLVAILCTLASNFSKKNFRLIAASIANPQVNTKRSIETPGWVEYVDKVSQAL